MPTFALNRGRGAREGTPIDETVEPGRGGGPGLPGRWGEPTLGLAPSTPNLSRRASLNAAAAGLDYTARTVIELLVTPFLVARLGSYLYGAWRVLWRLTGYLWATSGRSAQALQSAVANRQHSADDEEKRRLVGAAVVVWLAFLPLLLLLGTAATWVAPVILDAPPQHVWSIRMTAALLCADALALTLLTIPKSVLQGENQGYRRLGLSSALILLGGATTVLAVHLGMGIVGVALANLANTMYTGLLFWRVAARHVPWFTMARPTRRETRWFLGLSSWFMSWKFVNQLLVAGDVVVLGFFGSVELVTVYSLMKFIPEAMLPLIALLVQGGVPGLGGILGAREYARAVQVRAELMAASWLMATVVATTVVLWNRSFVVLWVGEQHYSGVLQSVLIVLMLVQLSMIRNDAFLIDLTLEVRAKVLLGLVAAGLSLGLAAVLLGAFDLGIPGLCIGIITGRSLLTIGYPLLIGRRLGQPLPAQVRAAVRPALTTIALLGAVVALGRHLAVDSWLLLVSGSALTAAVVAPLAAVVGLTGDQRRLLHRRLRKVVRR